MNRVLGVLVLVALTTGGAQAADCDRACLKGMITKYVDAVVAHDPYRLPLAAGVRFTEDSKDLKPGEGLWKTVTRKGDFRQDYIDQTKQIAASHVQLFEENAQILYSVVLRVANQKITGIETLVDRITPDSRFKPDSLEKPLGGMSAGARQQADAACRNDPGGSPVSRGITDRQLYRRQDPVRQGGIPRRKRHLHCRGRKPPPERSRHVHAKDYASSRREGERRRSGRGRRHRAAVDEFRRYELIRTGECTGNV